MFECVGGHAQTPMVEQHSVWELKAKLSLDNGLRGTPRFHKLPVLRMLDLQRAKPNARIR